MTTEQQQNTPRAPSVRVQGIVMRLRRLLGLHQCAATQKMGSGKVYICCVRHHWHIGQHKAHNGQVMRGEILRQWSDSLFGA